MSVLPKSIISAGVIERGDGQVLICRRDEAASPRQWEFPSTLKSREESPEAAMRRAARQFVGLEVMITVGQPPMTQEIDGRTITYRFYHGFTESGEAQARSPYVEVRWVAIGQLCEYDFAEPHLQVVEWLTK